MSSEHQKLVADLCRSLEAKGGILTPGTGVAIKDGNQVYLPPGEVHLDRLQAEDVFTFNVDFDESGNPELNAGATNPCHNISAHTKLFLRIFQEFDCGCVIYGQPTNGFVISEMFEKVFKIKDNQLITLISNGETKEQYPSSHLLRVPIIANPGDQKDLFSKIENSFEKFPETNAVLVKGNGFVVCGDTWQETKLMFETFIKLFQVAIELRRVGFSARPVKVGQKEISIVDETKSTATKRVVKKPAKVPTDMKTRIVEERPRLDREAVKRKKLALLRLRERTSETSSRRRNAASFLGPDSRPHCEDVNNMNMMRQMQTGMTNFNNSQMQYNNSHNMGYHGMNMGNNQMNVSGMTLGMCNPNPGNMMMMNQNPGMFLNPMERQGEFERMEEMREERARSRGRRGGRRTMKGSVKERLGFKSNITVDPVLLSEDNIDEEDY